MAKSMYCNNCFRRKVVEDKIKVVICPGCQEEMIEEKYDEKTKE